MQILFLTAIATMNRLNWVNYKIITMHAVINELTRLSMTIIFQSFWGKKITNWKKNIF